MRLFERFPAVLRCLIVATACLSIPVAARADVVPSEAVTVAEAWLELIDQGRVDEAVERYFEVPDPDDSRKTTARSLAAVASRSRVPIRSRTIRSWTGHGDGDTSRMAPGAYFSLVFDTLDDAGRAGEDEVRLVPHGDGRWRVVGYVRS